MKRILILGNSSVGLYSFRNELVLELVKKYELYVSLPDEEFVEEFKAEGCRIIKTAINRRGVNPIQDMKLFSTYLKLIEEVKPDAVLTYTIKPNVYGGMACRIKKVPYLVNITGLGHALEQPGPLQVLTKILYKMGLKKADTVFLQNQHNMEFFEKHKITKANKVLLPGSGVNTTKFTKLPWPEKNAFIFISRIMKEKGIDEYFYCAQEIKKEYPDAEFHILGGCEEDYTEALKREQENGNIIYHGAVKDVRPYLENVRCIIHPSSQEGMSNVCLEAAASGRAIITSDCHGCKETLINGTTGFTAAVHDKESFLAAVRRFMEMSSEEQKAFGDAGREYVKNNFDRQIVVDKYLSRLAELVD